MRHFMDYVEATPGVRRETYRDLLAWSVADLSGFWETLREFFDVLGDGFDGPALVEERMPGAAWYLNARLDCAENILRHALDLAARKTTAILHLEEDGSAAGRCAFTTDGLLAVADLVDRFRAQRGGDRDVKGSSPHTNRRSVGTGKPPISSTGSKVIAHGGCAG